MKIIPAYISSVNFKNTKPAFTSNPADNVEQKEIKEIQDVKPDYNVRVPIAYNHIEDIKLNDELTAKCYKLANGQNIVIVPKNGTTVVKTYVNTGSFNEPDHLRGISHYIEHNLFNGSEDLGDKDFFEEVNKMGANTNASTSFANTNYYITSNLLEDTDLENKIQLHAGMLQSPKFLLDKLEKEKKIVNSEINMCLSEDENLGFTQTIKNLFNIKSTSLDLVAGSTDNITALTQKDVVDYFNNNYYPANMTTVITGEVDPDKTMELVSKYFNSTKTPHGQRSFEKMTPIEKTVRQDIISPKSESGRTTIYVGFAGPENNNTKDKIFLQALSILAAGLENSKLSDIERRYGIGVNFAPERLSSRPNDKTLMMIETNVPEGKAEFALNEIYNVVDKLSKEPPTDEELTAIKNKMKKSFDNLFESSFSLNGALGTAFLNDDIEKIKSYNNIVDNMTAQDIINIAKKYIDLNKAALTVVHPHNTTEEQITNRHSLATKMAEYNVPFTGANKKSPINVDNIKTYRTANNYDVVLNNATTQTVQYKMNIEEHDWTPKKAAVADILSDLLNTAGTKTKTVEELSKISDKYAIDCGISADQYGIGIYANFPANTTKEALEYFEDRIKNPNLNQNEFEKTIARLKDIYSNTEVNPYDKFNSAIYKNTAYSYTPKDLLESLNSITLDDVRTYYDEIFTKGQAKVIVTGPFDKNPELKDEIFKSINTYPNAKKWDINLEKVYFPIEKTEVFTDTNLKNQTDIIQGYKYKNSGNIKDENCVALLNEILGGSPSSRLFMDLRETRHLAYAVSSNYSTLGDLGIFYLKIGTTTENQETGEKSFENVQKSIDGFNENIRKITTEKVSQEELEAAKKHLKTQIYYAIETNSGKNKVISHSKDSAYGIEYLNKRLENIDKITVDDIYNTANNIFNSKPIYSLTGTKASIEANKDYLKTLEN